MPDVFGRFPGHVSDRPAEIRVYPSQIEIWVEFPENEVSIVVDRAEVASVRVEVVLGIPTLSIVDVSGVPVASLAMDATSARRAKALIEQGKFETS
jgi:hypothetical protein